MPRHDETYMFLIRKTNSFFDEYRHLACYDLNSATVDAALEEALARIRSTTATALKRAHAWDVRDAAVRTRKDVT
jgi:hypothetical protein